MEEKKRSKQKFEEENVLEHVPFYVRATEWMRMRSGPISLELINIFDIQSKTNVFADSLLDWLLCFCCARRHCCNGATNQMPNISVLLIQHFRFFSLLRCTLEPDFPQFNQWLRIRAAQCECVRFLDHLFRIFTKASFYSAWGREWIARHDQKCRFWFFLSMNEFSFCVSRNSSNTKNQTIIEQQNNVMQKEEAQITARKEKRKKIAQKKTS